MNELPDLSPEDPGRHCSTCSKSATCRSAAIPVRLDLDLCLVFSANPEDYTNRGRIVTPLKDRIGSVIRTHYPLTREARHRHHRRQRLDSTAMPAAVVIVPKFMKEILEEIARAGPQQPGGQPAVRRQRAHVDRQLREHGLQRRAPRH